MRLTPKTRAFLDECHALERELDFGLLAPHERHFALAGAVVARGLTDRNAHQVAVLLALEATLRDFHASAGTRDTPTD